MTAFAAFAMSAMLWFSWRAFRSSFSPAVLYCASWTACLALAALMGNTVDQISGEAALTYIAAAAVFIGGTAVGQVFRIHKALASAPRVWRGPRVKRSLDIALLVCVACTPFYLREVLSAGGLPEIIWHLREARIASVETSGQANAFSLLRNLPVVPPVVMVIAIYAHDGTRRSFARILVAALLWGILGAVEGSKLVALQLPFFAVATVAIRNRAIPWKMAAVLGMAFSVTFLVGMFFTNFGHLAAVGADATVLDILEQAAGYAVGGVVGFSKFLDHPEAFGEMTSPLYVPMSMVNGVFVTFGGTPSFDIGSFHAPFVSLGPAIEGNVYSALYSYYDGTSIMVALLWLFGAGAFSGWLYRQLGRGRNWAFILYPWVAYAAVMSAYAEQLLASSQAMIKWMLVAAVLVGLGRLRGRPALAARAPSEKFHFAPDRRSEVDASTRWYAQAPNGRR